MLVLLRSVGRRAPVIAVGVPCWVSGPFPSVESSASARAVRLPGSAW